MQLVGVDTGGTFTDSVLLLESGAVGVGKALSTPGALERGVLASIAAAAADVGLAVEDALRGADFVVHGTTAGLNALLTGSGGRVGLLTTRGFEATVPMARANTIRGIEEEYKTEAIRWSKPPLLLSRRAIQGVAERVDADGNVVVPLDEDQARMAIRALAARGIDTIGVSLLWSHTNPVHELRLRELVAELLPGIPTTLSCELAPRLGEYERSMTVVLNAYVAPLMTTYITDLEARLREQGFAGTFLLTKNSGGIGRAAELVERPIETLNSGPVGGLVATAAVGQELGHPNVVATDVGGTSFDVGLVVAGRPKQVARPMIGRYDVATPILDIVSIGTGGGSIAWIDADLGSLRVGPASAGADPGPVSYGRGGTRPTVTDAAVVLGYVDRLGVSTELDAPAATEAISKSIAEPLDLEVHAAAEGILEVASAQMADLVRRATLMRGYDPSEFVLYAYGGAAPQYVGRYASQIGVSVAYIPGLAAVFSAFGAVSSDFHSVATQDLHPQVFDDPESLNSMLAELERRALAGLAGGPSSRRDGVWVRRRAGLRFFRQVNEVQVDLSDRPLDAAAVAESTERFRAEYERLVGPGTAASEAVVEVVNLSVEAVLALAGARHAGGRGGTSRRPEPSRTRRAWFEGTSLDCPVFAASRLPVDAAVRGPAFVELPTTTIVVYPRQAVSIDAFGHVRFDLGEDR